MNQEYRHYHHQYHIHHLFHPLHDLPAMDLQLQDNYLRRPKLHQHQHQTEDLFSRPDPYRYRQNISDLADLLLAPL